MEGTQLLFVIGVAVVVGLLLGRQTSSATSEFGNDMGIKSSGTAGMRELVMAGVAAFFSFFFFTAAANSHSVFPVILGILSFIAYWMMVPTWVYRDAKVRGGRATAWAMLVFFTNILGLFSYLVTRPERPRSCRRCGFKMREDYVVCPFCGPNGGQTCLNCQSMLEPDWRYCPYCQSDLSDPSQMNLEVSLPLDRTVPVPPLPGSPSPSPFS